MEQRQRRQCPIHPIRRHGDDRPGKNRSRPKSDVHRRRLHDCRRRSRVETGADQRRRRRSRPQYDRSADAGQTATINAMIAGNPGVGLTKTGAGTLVLGGANAYTGTTAINAGVVSMSGRVQPRRGRCAGIVQRRNLATDGARRFAGRPSVRISARRRNHRHRQQHLAALTTGWSGAGTLTKIGAGTLRLDGVGAAFSGSRRRATGHAATGSSQTLAGCSMIDVRRRGHARRYRHRRRILPRRLRQPRR